MTTTADIRIESRRVGSYHKQYFVIKHIDGIDVPMFITSDLETALGYQFDLLAATTEDLAEALDRQMTLLNLHPIK